eukprot:TRINITY_DN83847_c0_g1_i1.p1 TRINITY_DN83847_c0_g1~~TRINITY_DN83847_c0_g1_i1.p1  ORF type:complete len:398 (+),score=69.29 TRINITY_DN83847_c0_g1_i1:166-1359(+)
MASNNFGEKISLLEAPDDDEEPYTSMTYDARRLVTFEVFTQLAGTVWKKPTLWKRLGSYVVISLITAFVAAFVISDPGSIDTTRFAKIGGILSAIVGLLLGFFLSSSMTRWYACTNGFGVLFDQVRRLQMQLLAFGVPQELQRTILRYGLLSANCLRNDLYRDALPEEQRSAYALARWNELTADANEIEAWDGQVTPQERAILQKVDDPAQTVWVWATSLLTRMSADGEIPPMPSPIYGRFMTIAESAHHGILDVRASIGIQPPYIYLHMLIMLVSITNILTAVSFGLALGVSVDMLLASSHIGGFKHSINPKEFSQGVQNFIVVLVISSLGPFLYEALLEVAVCISQPFCHEEVTAPGSIPVARFLRNAKQDLRDAEMMTRVLPGWKQPQFKKPPA